MLFADDLQLVYVSLFVTGILVPELVLSLLLLIVGSDTFAQMSQSVGTDTTSKELPNPPAAVPSRGTVLGLGFLRRVTFIPALTLLLDALNTFNKLAPGCERDDNEALGWPGIIGMYI